MAYATDRVILYSRTYEPMGDLAPDEVISRVRHEVINLEHTLTLVTTRPLVEGTRLLTQDGTGKWREWVVSTPDDKHETGEHAIGTYVCIWSLQYDLMGCDDGAHAEPGMGSSCTGGTAVAAAIDGTNRWEVGSVDVAAVEAGKGCVMTIGKTAWERMSLVVDKWGGEVDAEIEVDSAGVVSRAVALRAHLGQTSVTRRFDWGHDLKSIRRTPEPGPRYCGIVPLGRGQTEYAEDDETTFEWPLTLTGDPEYYPEYTEDYILDPEASLAFRVPDGNGGWEYPKKTVTYDTDDVGELYELASADLYDQTHPKVTYEGDVLQFAAAGMEAQGVQLGDEVQTVDHGFAVDAPLRIQGRVVELEVNELSPRTDTHLVIGYVPETVASLLSSTISNAVTPLSRRISRIEGDTSIVHLQDLIDALNAEINATGGWWYAVPGMGTRTYDTAVTDPAVGTEASKVVEIRGGSIRIANSRTSGGDWDWKTLIVSGHIAAELVTAVNVTAGWIGNPSGTTFFDIDNDLLTIGGRTETQLLSDVDDAAKVATNYLDFDPSTGLDVGYEDTDAKVNVSGSGVDITDENGTSMTHVQAGKMRLGESAKTRAEVDYHSLQLIDNENHTYLHASDLRDASGNATITEKMVASGETSTFYLRLNATSTSYTIKVGSSYVSASTKTVSYFTLSTRPTKGTVVEVTYTTTDYRAKAFTAGIRSNSYPTGAMSFAEGNANEASGYCSHAEGNSSHAVGSYSHAEGFGSNATGIQSHAEGNGCIASGEDSHSEGYYCTASGFAAHAEGRECTASGSYSHAEGYNCTASWDSAHAGGYDSQASESASFAHGYGVKATKRAQLVCGKYNQTLALEGAFIFGNGTSDSNRSNGAYISGTQVVAGSFINSSDERIKTDIESLNPEEAAQFIRSLMPRSYVKQGTRELGFVAQEVERDEAYGDILVGQDTNYGYDDFRILNYQGIIAPLVAYAQSLERRIDQQQGLIDRLTECMDALEGKVS